MAKTARKAFGELVSASKARAGTEEEFRRQATQSVTERNERAFKNLVEGHGRELKMLESERTWIEQERARDVTPMNNKEITAINLRHDRRLHGMERKHNSFFGKMHRVFGGHRAQQRQVRTLNTARDREVGERTKQHVGREGQRQRSLTERHLRVEKDLVE